MVSNGAFRDFRVATVPASCVSIETVSLSQAEAEALGVEAGDRVRLAPLKDGGLNPTEYTGESKYAGRSSRA
jgi:arginine N-succinyltransferase